MAKWTFVAAIVPLLSMVGQAGAEMNGEIEGLEEGYMMYQAIDVCPLDASENAKRIVVDQIRQFELRGTEEENNALWEKVAATMPMFAAIGFCEMLMQELQVIEMRNRVESPPKAPAKPKF